MAGVDYVDAIVAAGGIEMILGPRPLSDSEADSLVAHAHGLCLLGGPDVDPAHYGAEPHPRTYGVNPEQDRFELALLHAARRAGRPVLAICRGMQVLNVALGGTLEQHLADAPGRLEHSPPTFPAAAPGSIGALLPVEVQDGSRLHRLLGAGSAMGAHSHHQAVADVAPGLDVVARSADGVIEGVEHRDEWLVGVQWHPEDTARHDPAMQRLFSGFVTEAARLA
jgi:putative glutamine amidotransferase